MNYYIGKTEELVRVITDDIIADFAKISGDFNPVHLDEDVASKSIFGRKIAHGMLVGSYISNVIGMRLPGQGTIYLEQNLKFLKPVYVGDTITIRVTISEILNELKKIYKLETDAFNQNNESVVEGYAIVKAP